MCLRLFLCTTGFGVMCSLGPVLYAAAPPVDSILSFSNDPMSSMDGLFAVDSIGPRLFSIDSSIAGKENPVFSKGKALTIDDAMASARENNLTIKQAARQIRLRYGDKLTVWSRFLPQAAITFSAHEEQSKRLYLDSLKKSWDFAISQRIIEFGKTYDREWNRLRAERAALYNYENTLASIFKSVRSAYFALALTRDQIKSQQEALVRTLKKLRKAEERLQSGILKKKDVLSFRLSVLNDRELLYRLKSNERSLLDQLKGAMGLSSNSEKFVLVSRPEYLGFSEDQCVDIAIKHNTQIADKQAEAEISKTRLEQYWLNYLPAASLSGSVAKGNRALELKMGQTNPDQGYEHQYAVDLTAKNKINFPDQPVDSTLKFTIAMTLKFPLFDGLRLTGDRMNIKEDYDQKREDIIAATMNQEQAARNAWYQFKLSQDGLDIVTERIIIEHERFEMNEALNELGRLSDDDLDNSRENYFRSQNAYLEKQFDIINKQEDLRFQLKVFE